MNAENLTTPGECEMLVVDLIAGGVVVRRHYLKEGVVRIGRRADSEILLPDSDISRCHARIERQGSSYWMVECESTNGVRVNGEVERLRELDDGDVIEIGRFTLVIGVVRKLERRMPRSAAGVEQLEKPTMQRQRWA